VRARNTGYEPRHERQGAGRTLSWLLRPSSSLAQSCVRKISVPCAEKEGDVFNELVATKENRPEGNPGPNRWFL